MLHYDLQPQCVVIAMLNPEIRQVSKYTKADIALNVLPYTYNYQFILYASGSQTLRRGAPGRPAEQIFNEF